MTIDDNVDFLNEAKKLFEDIANDPNINETVKTYFIIESLESAIDTMRKYQKIQEIMDSRPNDDAKSNSKALGEIEVVMYG